MIFDRSFWVALSSLKEFYFKGQVMSHKSLNLKKKKKIVLLTGRLSRFLVAA